MTMQARELYKNPAKRTIDDTRDERDSGHAKLLDYKSRADVEVFWDLNSKAKEHRMLKIRIEGEEAILNADELLKFIRWV